MEAFKLYYLKYYQRVYATCLLILKNYALAEEATQEAFLKAYTKLSTLKDQEKFGAWVAAIATKLSIDIYNQNKKLSLFKEEEVRQQYTEIWETPDNYEPCHKYIEKETNQEIRKAIYGLTPVLKQMVILKYYWNLTDPEIAEMLNIPVGTVKSSLYRARKLLEKKLTVIDRDYRKLI